MGKGYQVPEKTGWREYSKKDSIKAAKRQVTTYGPRGKPGCTSWGECINDVKKTIQASEKLNSLQKSPTLQGVGALKI